MIISYFKKIADKSFYLNHIYEPDNDEDTSKNCCICFTTKVNTVLFPCRHMCMCYDCA